MIHAVEDIPIVEVILLDLSYGRRWLIRECPYCGESHSHSAGPLDDNPLDDHFMRYRHCTRVLFNKHLSGNYRLEPNGEWMRSSNGKLVPVTELLKEVHEIEYRILELLRSADYMRGFDILIGLPRSEFPDRRNLVTVRDWVLDSLIKRGLIERFYDEIGIRCYRLITVEMKRDCVLNDGYGDEPSTVDI